MLVDNKIGITEQSVRDYVKTLNNGEKCNIYCVRHLEKWALIMSFKIKGVETNYVMSSQREKVRLFATLEAARKACNFMGGMTVIGE